MAVLVPLCVAAGGVTLGAASTGVYNFLCPRVAKPDTSKQYDLVLRMDSVLEGISTGWKIQDEEGHLEHCDGIIATVLGYFNKGKTYVLNQLTGAALPSDLSFHTEGLSFKKMEVDGRQLCVLDTAGSGSPVQHVTESQLQQKKALEQFLREAVFELGDIFLVVVNNISAEEQMQIHSLAASLEKSTKEDKKIVVIHNLRELDTEAALQQEICRIATMYVSTGHYRLDPQDIEFSQQKRTIQLLTGLKETRLAKFEYHVFLGKEGSSAGELNPWVFAKMRHMLSEVKLGKSYKIRDKVRTCFEKALPKVIEGPAFKVQFEDVGQDKYVKIVPEQERYQPPVLSVSEQSKLFRNIIELAGKSAKEMLECQLSRMLHLAPALVECFAAHGFANGSFPDGLEVHKLLESLPVEGEATQVSKPSNANVEPQCSLYRLKPQQLPYFVSIDQMEDTANIPCHTVQETTEALWIHVELPGVAQADLKLDKTSQENGTHLALKAHKNPPIADTTVTYRHRCTPGRSMGTAEEPLHCEITVPGIFETDPTHKKFENGVLALSFKRRPEGSQSIAFD